VLECGGGLGERSEEGNQASNGDGALLREGGRGGGIIRGILNDRSEK